ncbi:MAG: hypothetical protein WCL06_16475, partial [Bacteroidota bacterium]
MKTTTCIFTFFFTIITVIILPLAEKYKTLSFSPKNLLISHASKQSNALILKSIQQDTLIRIVGTLVESAELPPY